MKGKQGGCRLENNVADPEREKLQAYLRDFDDLRRRRKQGPTWRFEG